MQFMQNYDQLLFLGMEANSDETKENLVEITNYASTRIAC